MDRGTGSTGLLDALEAVLDVLLGAAARPGVMSAQAGLTNPKTVLFAMAALDRTPDAAQRLARWCRAMIDPKNGAAAPERQRAQAKLTELERKYPEIAWESVDLRLTQYQQRQAEQAAIRKARAEQKAKAQLEAEKAQLKAEKAQLEAEKAQLEAEKAHRRQEVRRSHAARTAKRTEARMNLTCLACGKQLAAELSTRRYCSNACRQSAYRKRPPP